jgi:hypothetical protein
VAHAFEDDQQVVFPSQMDFPVAVKILPRPDTAPRVLGRMVFSAPTSSRSTFVDFALARVHEGIAQLEPHNSDFYAGPVQQSTLMAGCDNDPVYMRCRSDRRSTGFFAPVIWARTFDASSNQYFQCCNPVVRSYRSHFAKPGDSGAPVWLQKQKDRKWVPLGLLCAAESAGYLSLVVPTSHILERARAAGYDLELI